MTPPTARQRQRQRRRRGFALLLVIGFNVLLLAVWSVAYRSVGSALRVEMTRLLRRTRDDGTITALGQGVARLQTGSPTHLDGSPVVAPDTYTCYVELTTPTGPRWFAVVYTPVLQAPDGTTEPGLWSVRAYAVTQGGTPTMPDTFHKP